MRPSSESLSVRRRETAVGTEVKAVGRCRAVTGLNPHDKRGGAADQDQNARALGDVSGESQETFLGC